MQSCCQLWLRILSTGRYQIELGINACATIRAVHEGHAARIIFTEVDRLHDLLSTSSDLSRRSIVDDVALSTWVVVQLDIEVVNTCLDLVIRQFTKFINLSWLLYGLDITSRRCSRRAVA